MITDSAVRDLVSSLQKAKETIAKQQDLLKKITSPPLLHGSVLSVEGDFISVAFGNEYMELFKPSFELKIGDTVALQADTKQIINKVDADAIGETAILIGVIDEEMSEVEYASSTKIVLSGNTEKKLEKGDKVVLDRSSSVILDNLGKDETKYTLDEGFQGISWDDIGGLANAKQEIIEAVELPYKYPKLYKHYNKRPPKGVLLYGPPGCGKTMLGKATATSIAKTFKAGHHGFIYVKGPEILNRYVGVTESIIRQLFMQAKEFKSKNGFPAVLFIDEADAILSKRGTRVSSDIDKTIVPMFLAEMDGLSESGALVMLVTNRPDTLDPAVVREGRVDIKLKIDRPDPQSTYDIFLLNISKVPLGDGCTPEKLSTQARDCLFSPDNILYYIDTKSRGIVHLTLAHIVSGSMIVNVVDRASSMALRRDITNKTKTGLLGSDIATAISNATKQNIDTDHKAEISDFVAPFRKEVVAIRKGGNQ